MTWNKGAWLGGWRSQEQALFVNRAPCCCAELSRGGNAASSLPGLHLLTPLLRPGAGKSSTRGRGSQEEVRHFPALTLGVAGVELGAIPPSRQGLTPPSALTFRPLLFLCTYLPPTPSF